MFNNLLSFEEEWLLNVIDGGAFDVTDDEWSGQSKNVKNHIWKHYWVKNQRKC